MFIKYHVLINTKGHIPNTCYMRNVGVPYGEFILVKKGTNTRGPKAHWEPNKF